MPKGAVPLIETIAISKAFPGVKALNEVDFKLEPGEVHVLFGENGAGKSTLISILSGVYRPTSGALLMNGEAVELHSVQDAARRGIGTVFQEFSLAPTMTVFENVYLGREPLRGAFIDRRRMIDGAEALFRQLGFEIDVRRSVSALSRAQQQMVEIAKAFHARVRVLILDEPTASLTEKETRRLFAFIAEAAKNGVGVIYISHRIQEFRQIADRISVLRDGRLIATVPAREASEARLVELMTGRSIDQVYPKIERRTDGGTLMTLRGVFSAGVRGVDIDVRAGEVLGVAGLVGSGKSRVWRSVLGLQPISAGTVTLNGRDVTRASTRRILGDGVFYLPPDRKAEGVLLTASVRDNFKLNLLEGAEIAGPFGLVSQARSRALADRIGKRVDIATSNMDRFVSKLSGGNQQKVLFGKGFGAQRDIYIFDEPTVGVDMGTRAALYRLIKEICEDGKGVVVISSDLPEVMNLSHRLLVFSKGRVSAELIGPEINEGTILKHFFPQTEAAA